jgi:hypothetical protein
LVAAGPERGSACESLMKTLKYEEVFRNEYRDLVQAHRSIGRFLDQAYNQIGFTPRWATVRPPSSRARF